MLGFSLVLLRIELACLSIIVILDWLMGRGD
jgi:hypothetical protein